MTSTACVELKDLQLNTAIGTYAPGATIPNQHLLDLILGISPSLVLIASDGMEHVFDYDPLVIEIDCLAQDGHYETQERLLTRIVEACARHSEVESIEASLRKTPVLENSGVLGIRLSVDADTLKEIRANLRPSN